MKRKTVIFAAAVLLGLTYGGLSGIQNQNPYYPVPGEFDLPHEQRSDAWHWKPSPVWLPSYLLCTVPRNGFGIRHTRSGYMFDSYADRWTYLVASTVVGAIMGSSLGAVIALKL